MYLIGAVIIATIYIGSMRWDPKSGVHRIRPISMETDGFGNWKIYYRVSNFAANAKKEYYWLSAGQDEIAELVKKSIAEDKEVMIHYGPWFGLKGFFSPPESPITKVDIIE